MIPTIHFEMLVVKLKLGYKGFGRFAAGRTSFYLIDSRGNVLSRIRKEDWFRILDDKNCPITLERALDSKGRKVVTLKYNFAFKE